MWAKQVPQSHSPSCRPPVQCQCGAAASRPSLPPFLGGNQQEAREHATKYAAAAAHNVLFAVRLALPPPLPGSVR